MTSRPGLDPAAFDAALARLRREAPPAPEAPPNPPAAASGRLRRPRARALADLLARGRPRPHRPS